MNPFLLLRLRLAPNSWLLRLDPFFAGGCGQCLRLINKRYATTFLSVCKRADELQNKTLLLSSSHCSSVYERLIQYGSEAVDSIKQLGLIIGNQTKASRRLGGRRETLPQATLCIN
jgi:hypothetical protein